MEVSGNSARQLPCASWGFCFQAELVVSAYACRDCVRDATANQA